MKHAPLPAFKGNEQALPGKSCVACGRRTRWRKVWARAWHEVKFCLDAYRKRRTARCAAGST